MSTEFLREFGTAGLSPVSGPELQCEDLSHCIAVLLKTHVLQWVLREARAGLDNSTNLTPMTGHQSPPWPFHPTSPDDDNKLPGNPNR